MKSKKTGLIILIFLAVVGAAVAGYFFGMFGQRKVLIEEMDLNARLNLSELEGLGDIAERMKKVMPTALAGSGVDMAFAQVSVLNDDVSVSYLVPGDEAAEETLKEAFGDRLTQKGSAYVLNPGISRKKELVPALTEVLQAHPRE